MRFDNAFVRDLPGDPDQVNAVRQVHGALWSPVAPTPVAAPRLLAHSSEMAAELGLSESEVASQRFADVFSGNALLPGMQTFATNYGGHQFGNWAGQLGDGRAISLGEAVTPSGARLELQLKGAGPTPYSRSADGRAVLRSSLREFLCSEAMHHLGIPTTRALSLVATGEDVVRDMLYDGNAAPEPGAIVCRVAPGFIRFGHFELPASRGDLPLLRQLVEFTIRRDFPELLDRADAPIDSALIARWFGEVARRTALLMVDWMRVGFVHGVMNTDNMSILGLTIDYGPYGWVDDFDPDWTPNTTDRAHRRYRFGQQPQVGYWNVSRLAGALAPLFGPDTTPLQAGLHIYADTFAAAERAMFAAKLGLLDQGESTDALMRELHVLLHASQADMTLWFRRLADLDPAAPGIALFEAAHYDADARDGQRDRLQQWLDGYAARLTEEARDRAERRSAMNRVNPKFVLRNYLAQLAIDRATAGDMDGIEELLDVMRHPYDEQDGRESYAARRPEWARTKVGCSMLSCSS